MQEVAGQAEGKQHSDGWSSLSFWVIATIGLALFALGVLSRPYVQRRQAQQQLAVEDAKVHRIRQAANDLKVSCESLTDDPKLLARQIRMDLGYRRPGDEPLSDSTVALTPDLAESELQVQTETRLDQVCDLFDRPVLSHAALASGLMLVGIALLCFDSPERGRHDAAA